MAGVVEETLAAAEREAGIIDAAITLDNVRAADHFARKRAEDIMAA